MMTNAEFIETVKDTIKGQNYPPKYNVEEWAGKVFNCYAYALQLCIDFANPELLPGFIGIRPGFVSRGKENDYQYCKEKTIGYFKEDCDQLGLEVFPTTVDNPISENEYKIALYLDEGYDFHFARQDSSGIWSEKNGWNQGIRTLEERNITKKEDGYEFIGVFRVSKKAG